MSASPDDPAVTPVILIVDDDAIVRAIMRAELEDEGFEVIEAEDGLDALEACRAALPDLVVVDVVMPRMDGYALCQALRRQPETAFVPILMSTGLDDQASIAQAYEAGAADFIPKPIQWTILRQRVRYMLRSAAAFEALRRSQASLIAAKEAAEAGNRAKSQFLAAMSHELRTPLNAVIGLSSVIQGQAFGPLQPRYLEFVGKVLDSGQHLLSMIEDMLDLARANGAELAIDARPTDIAPLMTEAEARGRALAAAHGLTFVCEVEAGLPWLTADPEGVKRMLKHLIGNAVKFTPAGAVCLSATREAAGLRLKVQDTGIGIPPDKLAQALAAFGQADQGSTREYGGAGIGLPLTRRLAELQGARLEVDSEVGKGTTVSVLFPEALLVDGASATVSAA